MKPIGPLMREHRLIEQMVGLVDDRLRRPGGATIDAAFVNILVDFLSSYADMLHHGKEEDIFFKVLATKPLKPEERELMAELIAEHAAARRLVAGLRALAGGQCGDVSGNTDVLEHLHALAELYPAHIAKEDQRFFYPSLEYLSDAEQAGMLAQFAEFDGQAIHRKYQGMVAALQAEVARGAIR